MPRLPRYLDSRMPGADNHLLGRLADMYRYMRFCGYGSYMGGALTALLINYVLCMQTSGCVPETRESCQEKCSIWNRNTNKRQYRECLQNCEQYYRENPL